MSKFHEIDLYEIRIMTFQKHNLKFLVDDVTDAAANVGKAASMSRFCFAGDENDKQVKVVIQYDYVSSTPKFSIIWPYYQSFSAAINNGSHLEIKGG